MAAAAAFVLRGSAPSELGRGTPYPIVQAGMRLAGFDRVRFVSTNSCGDDPSSPCRRGRLFCAADIETCVHLFARRSDDALFIVVTGSTRRLWGGYRPDGLLEVRRPEPGELEEQDFEAILPSGRHIRRSTCQRCCRQRSVDGPTPATFPTAGRLADQLRAEAQ
jgi:hypothetical protein